MNGQLGVNAHAPADQELKRELEIAAVDTAAVAAVEAEADRIPNLKRAVVVHAQTGETGDRGVLAR